MVVDASQPRAPEEIKAVPRRGVEIKVALFIFDKSMPLFGFGVYFRETKALLFIFYRAGFLASSYLAVRHFTNLLLSQLRAALPYVLDSFERNYSSRRTYVGGGWSLGVHRYPPARQWKMDHL